MTRRRVGCFLKLDTRSSFARAAGFAADKGSCNSARCCKEFDCIAVVRTAYAAERMGFVRNADRMAAGNTSVDRRAVAADRASCTVVHTELIGTAIPEFELTL